MLKIKKENMDANVNYLVYSRYLLLASLIVLPGCNKLIDYGSDTFNQVQKLDPHRDEAQKYLLSVTAYDQLSTVAKFDALWLSDDVRKVYSDLYALRNGKSDEQKMIFFRRQLEENYHFITFYVLSTYERPLGILNGEWSLVLRIKDSYYLPIEVKSIELAPEYIYIFGKKYNRFKTAYSVRFDAKDINDQLLIDEDTPSLMLNFRTVDKDVVLAWDLTQLTHKVVV